MLNEGIPPDVLPQLHVAEANPARPTQRPLPGPARVTDGVSSQVLGLWIDLVRQASGASTSPPLSPAERLSKLRSRALGCLPSEGLTMSAFAHAMGVSGAAATAIADQLTSGGATRRTREAADRRQVRLFPTRFGVRMASSHRRRQVRTLERLLRPMPASRATVLILAMQELGGSLMIENPWPDARILAPDPQLWTSAKTRPDPAPLN